MKGWAGAISAAVAAAPLAGVACSGPHPHDTKVFDRPDLSPDAVRSGTAFLTPETRADQADSFANPGYLWVDRGAALFAEAPGGEGKPCTACHGAGGKDVVGAAATYPKIDDDTGALHNLERRINACRVRHQSAPELAYESEDLLALTSFVANLSIGLPIEVETEGAAAEHLDAGRRYFFTRRGQLNLACSQCHDANWGKKLRGDTISQGHPNAFPAYRLEWQGLGSSHRRFRDCDLGVRADPLEPGAETYVQLELYLAARAQGLTVETPGIRR